MNIQSLKPAAELAQRFGVKSILYGPPGCGKTPLLNTAPRPVLCAVEPGLLSMRGSTIPTFDAYTRPRIDEFFKWFLESKEAAGFDTVGIDSISQLAEVILNDELPKNKDGRAAYGNMSRAVMKILSDLYYCPAKHVYLIAKEGFEDDATKMKRPHFPGQDLLVRVPHMFDEILHMKLRHVPGVQMPTMAIRTRSDFEVIARDRSGMLAELEPPNLATIFQKCMTV